MKRWLSPFLVLLLVIGALLTGCGNNEESVQLVDGKVKVMVSVYPLEDFAKKIGGEHVQVTNMIPPGTEAHDFELTPKDMEKITKSDLFVYNGAGFESWVDQVAKNLDKEKTVVVESTKEIELLSTKEHHDEHAHEEGHKEDEHDHGDFDPHVWLDPVRAKQQAMNIKEGLVQVDPSHKDDYEKNYQKLAGELDTLHQEYDAMTQQAKKKELVVSHSAFNYLASRYGLEQIAITGMSPSQEPSPKELKQIIETVKEHQVKYILFETLVSSKVAEVVRKEVKAEALTLNPLEGLTKEEIAQGADYFSVMRKNKENIAKALGVQP
ncbi:metal ABC transporter substrate-binding protein [Hazenella coriacea]|uniref:Zinc transport system substrate-binding protein n=1 Tax=Hazenella coriacea TaxID=1179467 RepID=A0A4R3L732_9BACL|nr:metal ABC transporter substrate-binding protein [Hazenella coriacea]TCS95449.1 zinc transport system substrate-binding protein [Hazenella coriacea]